MVNVRSFLLTLIVIGFTCTCLCQKHDNIWLFGYGNYNPEEFFGGSMLDFSVEPPLITHFAIPVNFTEIAMISDVDGKLVAYTDGCKIINANHELAVNGDSINPGITHDQYCDYGYPASQGGILISTNGGDPHYRLLHTWQDRYGYVTELRSSDIVNEENEVSVINKNYVFRSNLYSLDISAVRHANGRDWWTVMARYKSNVYEKLISFPNGVAFVDTQQIGMAWSDRDWSGQVTHSSDGKKFVRVNPYNGLHIFDFDRCTGELSNPVVIDFPGDTISSSGAAFSPDSRFLYVSASRKVYQFDMSAKDIESSRETVAVYDGFIADYGLGTRFYHQMLAPDGRIYITAPSSVRYLHVINQPKEKGEACHLVQHGVTLPALHAFATPNFPHYRLGPVDGSPCDTLGMDNNPVAHFRYAPTEEDPLMIRFTDLSHYEPDTWSWSFGDDQYASGADQMHTYEAPGVYEVCLEVSNQNSSDVMCQTVEVTLTSMKKEEEKRIIRVAPNPFGSYLNIFSLDGQDYEADIAVYDLFGNIVLHKKKEPLPNQINTQYLIPGMYLCVARVDGQIVAYEKLMKQ